MKLAQGRVLIEEDLQRVVQAPLPWSQLEGKTFLITGANGFLPAYMVEVIFYLNRNVFRNPARVIALVRNSEHAARRFSHLVKLPELRFLVNDVSDPFPLDEDPDFIVHAASQASPKYYSIDPVGTIKANAIGTYRLLELSRNRNVECFFFFSSGEVYGEVDETSIPIKESDFGYLDPAVVRSCYGESKRIGETLCVGYAHQFHVPAKIVRPFHTYGPGMKLDDGRVFADFVSDIVNNRDITLNSDGSARRAFCYLADATAGFFSVLLRGEVARPYNIGNPDGEISILELAELLVSMFPERELKVIRKKAGDPAYLRSPIRRNSPHIGEARKLGWLPWTSVAEGFRRTVWSFE